MVDGYDIAKRETLKVLDLMTIQQKDIVNDKPLLVKIARTSISTKLEPELADQLAEIVTQAVLNIRDEKEPIDLHMVEIMHMKHKMQAETRLIKGLVLDHGARNNNMKKEMEDCYILTANVSLEYEKTEVNSSLAYSSAEQRKSLVDAERAFTDEKVRKIIEFKRKMCDGTDAKHKNFVLINQKGIDPISLDMLQHEGILALRRAKRRNMERLTLACGGTAINSVDDLTEKDLGFAGKV